MYLAKHGKWLSQHLSENRWWVPCQKESQATISERSHVQVSFIQQKAHLCLRPCSLDNTLNKPSTVHEKVLKFETDASGWVGLAMTLRFGT